MYLSDDIEEEKKGAEVNKRKHQENSRTERQKQIFSDKTMSMQTNNKT